MDKIDIAVYGGSFSIWALSVIATIYLGMIKSPIFGVAVLCVSILTVLLAFIIADYTAEYEEDLWG